MSTFDLGILLALVSSVTFVIFSLWSREVQHREGPWRYMVYISLGPALVGLATWLVPAWRPEFSWPLVRGAAYAAMPAMCGLFFLGLACRWGDISHVGPVMGSKALVITVLAVTFGFEPVAPEFWGASAILLVALFLVSGNREVLRRPWRIVEPALVFALLMCIFASLADLISRQQMARHALPFWSFLTVGWVLRGTVCTLVLLVVCAIRRLPVLPRRASTFLITTPVVVAHGFAIVGAFEKTNSAVLTNVLTSLRGMLSVVAVLLLARLGFSRRERLTRPVIVVRIVGSLLICSGVWLGLAGRETVKPQPADPSPKEEARSSAAAGAPAIESVSPRRETPPPVRQPATLGRLYARAAAAIRAGRPVVVTVHVCLCDNRQGIAPVNADLGNGDSPRTNLYWGALYGVRTFLARSSDWKLLAELPGQGDLLKVAVFRHRTTAGGLWPADVRGKPVEMILVARAWRGMPMVSALGAFARDALTAEPVNVRLTDGRTLVAGGASHVVGFVGHDSLMNASVRRRGLFREIADGGALPVKGWFALACVSDKYFTPRLGRGHLVRLLATRQFMAPEAYTLDAMLRTFARGGDLAALRSAAASAYAKYQKISPRAALGVFTN